MGTFKYSCRKLAYNLVTPLLQSPSLREDQDTTVKAIVNVRLILPLHGRLSKTKRTLAAS